MSDQNSSELLEGASVEARSAQRPNPQRSTLASMAAKLRDANPLNEPMYLRWIAAQWWPDADWLHSKVHNHNGGGSRGVRVAGAFAGRLERAGFLRMCGGEGSRRYVWCDPPQNDKPCLSGRRLK